MDSSLNQTQTLVGHCSSSKFIEHLLKSIELRSTNQTRRRVFIKINDSHSSSKYFSHLSNDSFLKDIYKSTDSFKSFSSMNDETDYNHLTKEVSVDWENKKAKKLEDILNKNFAEAQQILSSISDSIKTTNSLQETNKIIEKESVFNEPSNEPSNSCLNDKETNKKIENESVNEFNKPLNKQVLIDNHSNIKVDECSLYLPRSELKETEKVKKQYRSLPILNLIEKPYEDDVIPLRQDSRKLMIPQQQSQQKFNDDSQENQLEINSHTPYYSAQSLNFTGDSDLGTWIEYITGNRDNVNLQTLFDVIQYFWPETSSFIRSKPISIRVKLLNAIIILNHYKVPLAFSNEDLDCFDHLNDHLITKQLGFIRYFALQHHLMNQFGDI